jgi:cytochrome c-type biogenesis protein CcmE
MRARYTVGAGLILGAFIVIALVAYFANQELYLTVDELVGDPALYAAGAPTDGAGAPADAGRRFQVRGTIDHATVDRATEGLEMRFSIAGTDARLPVVYHGVVPDSFDQADVVTVAGRVLPDGTLDADDLLVQCPSKYEAVPPGAASPAP